MTQLSSNQTVRKLFYRKLCTEQCYFLRLLQNDLFYTMLHNRLSPESSNKPSEVKSPFKLTFSTGEHVLRAKRAARERVSERRVLEGSPASRSRVSFRVWLSPEHLRLTQMESLLVGSYLEEMIHFKVQI